jgi:hypothetical protein
MPQRRLQRQAPRRGQRGSDRSSRRLLRGNEPVRAEGEQTQPDPQPAQVLTSQALPISATAAETNSRIDRATVMVCQRVRPGRRTRHPTRSSPESRSSVNTHLPRGQQVSELHPSQAQSCAMTRMAPFLGPRTARAAGGGPWTSAGVHCCRSTPGVVVKESLRTTVNGRVWPPPWHHAEAA